MTEYDKADEEANSFLEFVKTCVRNFSLFSHAIPLSFYITLDTLIQV